MVITFVQEKDYDAFSEVIAVKMTSHEKAQAYFGDLAIGIFLGMEWGSENGEMQRNKHAF